MIVKKSNFIKTILLRVKLVNSKYWYVIITGKKQVLKEVYFEIERFLKLLHTVSISEKRIKKTIFVFRASTNSTFFFERDSERYSQKFTGSKYEYIPVFIK